MNPSAEACPLCDGNVTDTDGYRHKCGHLSHAQCLQEQQGGKINYKQCGVCAGDVVGSAWPSMDPPDGEPHTTDGRDYVLCPGVAGDASLPPSSAPQTASAMARVAGFLTRKQQEEAPPVDVRTTQDPRVLIAHRVPVEQMMRRNRVGLDHILRGDSSNGGVKMEDFLTNRYTWKDLTAFEDVQNKSRVLDVLRALGTNANHFRVYPGRLPFDEVAAHAGLQRSDLYSEFGLFFPEGASLQCYGDDEWGAEDCVKLGLKMDDLMDFGLQYVEQYEDLFSRVSDAKAKVLEKQLGTTSEHVDMLEMFEKPAPSPAPVEDQQPALQQHQQQVEYQQPESQPQYQPEQPAQKIVHQVPQPPRTVVVADSATPVWQARSQKRYARHGALKTK